MMAAIHIRSTHRRQPLAGRPMLVDSFVTLMIAALLAAVVMGLAALAPVAWTLATDGNAATRVDDVRQCVALKDNAARLACFDGVADRPLPQPAKGANAPAGAFFPKH
jgi:hypothetical protein